MYNNGNKTRAKGSESSANKDVDSSTVHGETSSQKHNISGATFKKLMDFPKVLGGNLTMPIMMWTQINSYK